MTVKRKQLTVEVRVTECCNLECSFCASRKRDLLMPIDVFYRLLTEVRLFLIMHNDYFCEFSLTGGEPTLHPDLGTMISHICGTEQCTVYIRTNGVGIEKLVMPKGSSGTVDVSQGKEYPEFSNHAEACFMRNNPSWKIQRYLCNHIPDYRRNPPDFGKALSYDSGFQFLGIDCDGEVYRWPDFKYDHVGYFQHESIESLLRKKGTFE